ncbi:hypothetical protein D3C81_534530 [compost metagenome]|uniref:Ig-like domain-containing protein n=1 Tax=Serratia liquefaciens TaxID=614 RepID=A0ABX7DD03_SERLI|nr:hypothetical protein [Serratia liquefaciens]QQU58020.1 hypothetical protein I6I38_24895 [Serratia liquefaciens]
MNALPEQGQYILYSGLINSTKPEAISISSYLKEKGFDYLKRGFRNFEEYPPEIISNKINENFISLGFNRGDVIVNFKKTVTTPGIYSFTMDLNPYKGSSFGDEIINSLWPKENYHATFFIFFMEIKFDIEVSEQSKNIRNIIQRKGDEKNGIYALAHKNIDDTVYLIAKESPVSLHTFPSAKIDLSLSGSYPPNISITQTDFYGLSDNLLNSVFCMFKGNTGGGGKYVFDLQADLQEKIGNVFHSNFCNDEFHFNVIGDIDIFPNKISVVSVGGEISMRLTTSGDARFNNLSVYGDDAKILNLEIKNNILLGKAPEKPGQYSFTVSAKDELDNRGGREYILTVLPQLSLSPQKANLPKAVLNKKYSVQFDLTDHVRKASFSLKGKYPKGLRISNNGLLSGIPKESGDWELTISAIVKEPDNTEFVLEKKYHLLVDSKYDHEVKNMGRWVTGNFKRYNLDVPFKLDPDIGVEVMLNNMPSWLQFSDDYKSVSGTPGLADWTGKEIFLIFDFFPDVSGGVIVEETYSLYVSSNDISITPSSLSPGKIGSLYKEPLSTKQNIFEPTFLLLNKEAQDIGLSVIVKDGRSFISGIIKRTKLTRVPIEVKVQSGYGDEGSIKYYLDLDRDIQLDIFPPKDIYIDEEAEVVIKINESSFDILPEDFSLNLISMMTIHTEPSLRLYKKSDGREWLLKATFHFSGIHKFGIEVKSGEKIMCVREVTLKVRSNLEIETVPKHLPLGNVNTPYRRVEIKCIGAASGEINYKEYGLSDDWHFQQKNNTAYIFGTPRKPSPVSFVVAASDSTGAIAMSQQIIDVSGPPVGVNQHVNVRNDRSVVVILTSSNSAIDFINRATSASFVVIGNDSSVNVKNSGKVIEKNGVSIGEIIGPDNNGVILSTFLFDKSQVHGHFSIHYVLSNRYGNSPPYLLDFSILL